MKYELSDCIEKLIPELSEYYFSDNGNLNINVTLPSDGVIYLNYLYALHLFEKSDILITLKARISSLCGNEPIDLEEYRHFRINTVFNEYTRITLKKEE